MQLRKLKAGEGPIRKALLSNLQSNLKDFRKESTGKQVAKMRGMHDGGMAGYAKGGAVEKESLAEDAGENESAEKKPPFEGGVRNNATDDNDIEDGHPINEYQHEADAEDVPSDIDPDSDTDSESDKDFLKVEEHGGSEEPGKTESLEELIKALNGVKRR